MDATLGTPLAGDTHLAQSIGDILSTPIGSRVMRRDYGSLLFSLIDGPINGAMRLLLQAATAIALRRWEPRLRVTRVTLGGDPARGNLAIRVQGTRTDMPAASAAVDLTIPLNRAAEPA